MGSSTVLFMERTIIGNDPRVRHVRDAHRFEYANGSILVYGGMKDEEQREQIRGIGIAAGVDIFWMEEATRFSRDDFGEVLARMRGHAAPWQQIILSTNPGAPSHWIYQDLMMGGGAVVYDQARPEDNPYNPPAYIGALHRLTGILRQRLLDGLWVQAEGLVYPEFDLDNLTDEEPDLDGIYELGIDDGYVDPRAILFIQRTGSHILVFDELYHSRHLAQVCVDEAIKLGGAYAWTSSRKLPEIAIISPEAKELRERLRMADIPARGGDNDVLNGIEAVRAFICDGNGYRTLKVHRRCKNLIRELTETYLYPDGSNARRNVEKPADGGDHACDALRYWIKTRA